ncbi:hypothetical protein ACQP1K_25920 [Sphaerimonospora sp. CA-214678]|uniref:hypothetical protein n=1 Tax=Sphaerimonospora sp. CA-214678 TaxID=3240029 RepID=UPI003D92DEDE
MAERTPLTPPDPSGLEAWIRQVLRLAGPRASAHMPPLPAAEPIDEPTAEPADDPGADSADVASTPPRRDRPGDLQRS